MSVITREMFDMHRRARLGVAYRLGLHKRVPDLLRKRGWPTDEGLNVVLAAAIACKVQGAGGEVFRRPAAADGLPEGRWGRDEIKLTASQIVASLELEELLVEA